MPIPDVCIWGNDNAGPGAPDGTDGSTPVGPENPVNGTDTGPAEGPLDNYHPGYGTATPGRPELMLTANMKKTLYVQLTKDPCAKEAVDLSQIDHIKFLSKEWLQAPEMYLEKDVEMVDAAGGLVKVSFEPDEIPYAGIWPSAFACYNANDELIANFECYLYIKPNYATVGSNSLMRAPLTIHEVRMAMRDVCPEFNTLLEDVEFSDEDIMFAMIRPIREWNETPPDLSGSGGSFTQNTFPWRDYQMRATIGYLLNAAAIHQQRNQFNYSAGGVSIRDKDKATPYLGISERLLGEWREFILLKKKEINANLCYGSVRSISFGAPYGWGVTYW